MATDSDEIAAHVLAHVQGAADAVRERDIGSVVQRLDAAEALYEQHPSCVHEPTSQLRDLLVFHPIGAQPVSDAEAADDDLRELEERAEALRQSALH